jgi:hypothetical protein
VENDTWTEIPRLPFASDLTSATRVGSRIFVTGHRTDKIAVFNPIIVHFSLLNCTLPVKGKFSRIFAAELYIYVVLGHVSTKICSKSGEILSSIECVEIGAENLLVGPSIYHNKTVYMIAEDLAIVYLASVDTGEVQLYRNF